MLGFSLFSGIVFKGVLAAILAAAAIGAIVYLAVKITANFFRKYKQKKSSEIVMGKIPSLIKNIPDKEKRTFTPDQLEALEKMEDETIVAEYDENTDELVQANWANHDLKWDSGIDRALRQNDGIILVKD